MTPAQLRAYSFSELLRSSIIREDVSKAWCSSCNDYKATKVRSFSQFLFVSAACRDHMGRA